jgi:spore coat-associated protein N
MPTPARTRSPTKLSRKTTRRLAALGLLLVAVAVAVGSGANFTAAAANPSNAFSTGTLAQTNSKDNAAILTASGLRPGDSSSGTVDIQNSGSLSGQFSLARGATTDTDVTNPLSAKLNLVVTDCGAFNGTTAPDCATGTQKYSGTIAAMPKLTLTTFAAGEKRRYRFVVAFPDGGAGADNAYQGDSTTVEYTWSTASS